MGSIDFDVCDFADLLETLPAHPPITEAMISAESGKGGNVWYSSQREHMVGWFYSQATTGSGSYTRQVPNVSARVTYNRLQCPQALVWMAEALGADTQLVQQVATDALSVPWRSRSKFVRQHLPWDMIAELAQSKIEALDYDG